MNELPWPTGTAPPAPDGTHWVVAVRLKQQASKLFLKPASARNVVPTWTNEEEAAGVWPKADAERLAELYADVFEQAGQQLEVQAEWIGPT